MFKILGMLLSGIVGAAGGHFIGWESLPFTIVIAGFIGYGAAAIDDNWS